METFVVDVLYVCKSILRGNNLQLSQRKPVFKWSSRPGALLSEERGQICGSQYLCRLFLFRWWVSGSAHQPGDLGGDAELFPRYLDSTWRSRGPIPRHLRDGGRGTHRGGEMKLTLSKTRQQGLTRQIPVTIKFNWHKKKTKVRR